MSVPDRRPSRSDLGPVTREYVKAMGWRSVNMHTHISLVHSYVYVEVPQGGCGTMKATLVVSKPHAKVPGWCTGCKKPRTNRINATPFVKPFQLPPDLLRKPRVVVLPDASRLSRPATRVVFLSGEINC